MTPIRRLYALIFALFFFPFTTYTQAQDDAQISATLLASALNHAVESGLGEDLVAKLYDKDLVALFRTAKSMFTNPRPNTPDDENDKLNAMQIFYALAGGKGPSRILSMVQLGFAYSENEKDKAIQYFVQAGEDGPHQGSLYNAGRLFAEQGEFAPSLGYMRAAFAMSTEYPEYAKTQMTLTSKEGYSILSMQLQEVELSLQEMVDIFPYADIENFPAEGSKAEKIWTEAMVKFQSFLKSKKTKDLEASIKKLSDLQMTFGQHMSALQTSLLRRILVIMLEMVNNEL
jgi:tetratricopeptide (TPR) repeat protein